MMKKWYTGFVFYLRQFAKLVTTMVNRKCQSLCAMSIMVKIVFHKELSNHITMDSEWPPCITVTWLKRRMKLKSHTTIYLPKWNHMPQRCTIQGIPTFDDSWCKQCSSNVPKEKTRMHWDLGRMEVNIWQCLGYFTVMTYSNNELLKMKHSR